MNRGNGSFVAALCISILLHLALLFNVYIRTVSDRIPEGDGRVALVRAVILAAPPEAVIAVRPEPAEVLSKEAVPPPEEAQLKLQNTEPAPPVALSPREVTSLEAVPREAASETISTVPEVAPADAPVEVTESPVVDARPPGGDAPGSEALITHIPAQSEAAPGKPAVAAAQPVKEPVKEPVKTSESAPTVKPQEEVAKEAAAPAAVPQDLPEAKPFLPIYRVERKPELVDKAILSYPPKARELNIQGTVILEVNIDEKGKVGDIRVIKSVGFGLDEEAVRWMRASSFSPAYVQDKPVAVRMQYPVMFKLIK